MRSRRVQASRLHASVPDYHCSGAWNALGVRGDRRAPAGARRAHALREALGIAEYCGPRGQILRVCAHPTMVKDGSGWGAHAGVTAALLARDGFTGAPAVTVEDEAFARCGAISAQRWRIREQYFKAYPVCRWAQPAIEAALALKREHGFDVADVDRVGIESFREAIDLGSQCPSPATTDEAQYSLPYRRGGGAGRSDGVGAEEVGRRRRCAIRASRVCSTAIELTEDAEFSRRFPAERWARVRITLARRPHAGVGAGARARQSRKSADRRRTARQVSVRWPSRCSAPRAAARIEALVGSLVDRRLHALSTTC